MSFVLVVNASAGNAAREAVAAAEEVLRRTGGCELIETEGVDHVDEVLAALGGRQVVVSGGDGSVHLVVERLRHAGLLDEVTLGWVPLGTGNDLARTLAIPLDPVAAAEVITAGRARRLDLVVADDGVVCVNAAHAGVGADAAARADGWKQRVGGVAYPLGALSAGVSAAGWDLTIEVDGEPVRVPGDGPVLLVAVMNGRTVGGGAELAPDARPDDGSLDVVVWSPVGPAQRAAFGVALQAGRHLDRDDVVSRRGATVRISGDPIAYDIDGELGDADVSDRRFTLEPGGWRILAPG